MKDFHTISAPAPAPRRRPSKTPRRSLVIGLLVAALCVGGFVAYKLARDGASSAAPVEGRYCELSGMLGDRLASIGIPPAGPAPESVRPVDVRRVLEQLSDEVTELERVAPREVRGEVRTVLAALRGAAGGDVEQIRAPDFVEAERTIVGFLQTDPCGRGTPPGDVSEPAG